MSRVSMTILTQSTFWISLRMTSNWRLGFVHLIDRPRDRSGFVRLFYLLTEKYNKIIENIELWSKNSFIKIEKKNAQNGMFLSRHTKVGEFSSWQWVIDLNKIYSKLCLGIVYEQRTENNKKSSEFRKAPSIPVVDWDWSVHTKSWKQQDLTWFLLESTLSILRGKTCLVTTPLVEPFFPFAS